ncbi:helix-turn-helix domain-containing protein [Vibrio sp. SCSIO 43137]|uniref:helix-turn-helix domain-containing protein n=1 Tax=Vibrio sp. SCSIO 43137 TaxID=3021011 RepID=UPI0023080673|nr:helix-turn-helix domain-containing protein [Vibrio sp. SCSIO 43137]WCE32221.1 helix-turn-helix domain-containing protein [Vibrio sp. SCSIO 43137]
MFNTAKVSSLMQELQVSIPFLSAIHSEEEHEQALALVEELIEDYDNNLTLIELLSLAIERYEDSALEFEKFNKVQEGLDSGIAMLRVLMEQHELKMHDFENEIGKKSLVSQILNGKKNLTKKHIAALSERFGINPSLFF